MPVLQPIDMLSAIVIGGAGALIGAAMMLIAMQADAAQRPALRACLAGFLVLGTGLVQNALADRASRLPILAGAMATVLGILLIARGLVSMATGRVPRWTGAAAIASAVLALVAAWPFGPYVFAVVFHSLCVLVSLGMAHGLRRCLRAPANAAESAVAVTVAFHAATWVYCLAAAIGYDGPELRHLMYMGEPMLTVYAITDALMPLVVGALVLNLANARLGARLQVQASTDELTGLLSRRALLEGAAGFRARARAAGRQAAVLLLDVDHFKRINDSRGHEGGDEVLRVLARRMRGQLRADSLLGRYGGEEFLVLLDASGLAEAEVAAERLRAAIRGAPVALGDGPLRVTISVGVALWPDDGALSGALARADAALYRAKHAGRDCVALAGDTAAAGPALPPVVRAEPQRS